MTALILDYFGDWRTRPLVCPTCGWTGTFEEGWTELYDALQDCQCPGEHGSGNRPMLAVVPHPTLEQWQAHADRLSPAERAYIGQIENGRERFNRLKLQMASQLPDLPDPVLDLLWDQEAEDLVIRLGAREVWRELIEQRLIARLTSSWMSRSSPAKAAARATRAPSCAGASTSTRPTQRSSWR